MTIDQPKLFDEAPARQKDIEEILLFALGDFQSRGLVLADRALPLDRLRGAIKRATDHFGTPSLTDDQAAEGLERIGARVEKLKSFVAKHPYRITVPGNCAEESGRFYKERLTALKGANEI